MRRRIDRDAVLAGLSPAAVLRYFGIPYSGDDELRTTECPNCGSRSRESVSIRATSGLWICHSCNEGGDLLMMVAKHSDLDVRADFVEVLEIADKIARRHPQKYPARTVRGVCSQLHQAEPSPERPRAIAEIPARWEHHLRRSEAGEQYLLMRGLDATMFVENDVVRFTSSGDVVVRLWDLSEDRPINLVTRRRVPRIGRKVVGLKHCPTDGSLIGAIADFDSDSVEVILTEGVFDTLAAMLIRPTALVLGAHGAGRLEKIANAIAPKVAAINGTLFVVPHADGGTGEREMAKAVRAAVRAGLAVDESLVLVDVAPHKDLAEAVRGRTWGWNS